LKSAQESEATFPLVLGICPACHQVQITRPVPASELKARVDWIRYNEQEGHLDDFVETICRLPNVNPSLTIGAISFKDDTMVERFKKRGFVNAWRLAMDKDLGIADPTSGLESIQDCLTPEQAKAIAARRGRCDILVARHILEHAHVPRAFVTA